MFKVLHHLGKIQLYLEQAIDITELLVKTTTDAQANFKRAQNQDWDAAVKVAGRTNHSACGNVCYGPKDNMPSELARRLR